MFAFLERDLFLFMKRKLCLVCMNTKDGLRKEGRKTLKTLVLYLFGWKIQKKKRLLQGMEGRVFYFNTITKISLVILYFILHLKYFCYFIYFFIFFSLSAQSNKRKNIFPFFHFLSYKNNLKKSSHFLFSTPFPSLLFFFHFLS